MAQAAEPTEAQVMAEVVEIARRGGLGFPLPEGWGYEFHDLYGACGRFGSERGCVAIADENPIEPGKYIEPVWALTSRSRKWTDFFRDSASANARMEIVYMAPDQKEIPSVTFIQPQPFTALEMAAYVLGHEVDGHLNHQDGGWSDEEMQANYYGLSAVRALRRYLAEPDQS